MTEQLEAVQRMQDYIAAHIAEEVSIGDIAAVSGFSPWYARRLFIDYLGVSPAEYVRKLKLRESALRLRDGKTTVLSVAMDLGFGSVDGYQRAFYREFDCNPKEYGKNPIPIPLFTPYGVKGMYTERRELDMSAKTIFVQTEKRPVRKVIIKRGINATEYWTYCQEVGCDVWGILTSIRSIADEPVCLWLPKHLIAPGTSEYVQGVEVPLDYDGKIPEGFDVIELPESEFLLFKGEPFEEENFEQAIIDVWEAEKKYDPAGIGYEWDDRNPRIQLEPRGDRGYMEYMPVRKK